MARTTPPLLLPRGLIFGASAWLIGSWLISFGIRTPVQPSSATFTPAVRLMTLCVAIGLMIGWPLMRLSQRRTPWPLRTTVLDLVTLLAMLQVVLWPMRIVTNWPPIRTAAIDATVAGWMLLTGAIIASAIGTSSRGPRNLAMAACLALCLAGPALAWFGVLSGADWMQMVSLSPLMAINTLGEGGGAPPTADQWQWILLLLGAAGIVWFVLVIVSGLRRSPPASSD